ncbi:hypothetical protein [Clostridium estertheticum]|uniref:hypothetical protein n=1 Tax=Clostridium estertheticum TaxID=238834 RepID=UPI001CF278F8|nr:hypothetical protein [Clostridium estertheticum]MCB2353616.1 hypothetical protein [Clostridium estertheticum]WAG40674.1 hypothetical protein LL065_20860 [Clostridium estertheticum]
MAMKYEKLMIIFYFFIKKYGQNRYLDIIMPIVTFMGNMGIIWFIISIALILDKPYRIIFIVLQQGYSSSIQQILINVK